MTSSRSNSSRKTRSAFYALLVLAGIGCTMLFVIKPDLFPFGSTSRFVQSVVIEPEGAARDGAQWRVITQWQDAGSAQPEILQLVEFKPIPGWTAPPPVVLKKGALNARVSGVYQPTEYSEEIILKLEGATTMSSRLAPELAQYYLTHLGANEVRRIPGKDEDDIAVQGIFYSSREIRTIQINGGGTPWGFSALRNGLCDIAMAANRPSSEEAALFSENILDSDIEHLIGMDAVAIVVHRDNPVPALTMNDVGRIFSGEIVNWSQVGGPSAPIKVFGLRDSFGARRFVQQVFMGGKSYAASVRDVDVHSMMSDFVSEDPYAIGFCSIAFANQCRAMPVKADAGAEAVPPSPAAIRAHMYPAYRDLYLYQLSKSRNVYARDFIRMAQSAGGQELVARYGFVSVRETGLDENRTEPQTVAVLDENRIEPQTAAVSAAAEKKDAVEEEGVPAAAPEMNVNTRDAVVRNLAADALPPLDQIDGEVVSEATRRKVLDPYKTAVTGATPLPMVLRFEFGSTRLDQQSKTVFDELIKVLNSPAYAGKQVVLVGFSDSAGSYASNLVISRQRTEAVAKAMRKSNVRNVMVLAVGEEEPMEPNKTRHGRERNRRIQVWVKE